MIKRLVLVLLVAAAVAPVPAQGAIGDLAFKSCVEARATFSDYLKCPTWPVPMGSKVAFNSTGSEAFTFSGGVVARHTVNGDGTLTLVDCVKGAAVTAPCATVNGLTEAGGDVLVSQNDQEVYVLSYPHLGESQFVHFNRDGGGAMTFGSCLSQTVLAGCTQSSHLFAPDNLLQRGTQLFFIGNSRLLRFSISGSGTPVFLGCHGGSSSGCAGSIPDGFGNAMALSPDGNDLYAVGGASLRHFKFNGDGTLAGQPCFTFFVPNYTTCATVLPNCCSAQFMAISPDGTSLYTSGFSFTGKALEVFDRNPATGTLTPDPFCIGDLGTTANPCGAFRGLGGTIADMVISPDNAWAYTYGESLTILQRSAGGALTRIRCLQGPGENAGCTRAGFGVRTFGTLDLRPGGAAQLYAGSGGSLAIFDRVEYVPPTPPDPAPLNEQQGTRTAPLARSESVAVLPAATPSPAPVAPRRGARTPGASARVTSQTVARSRPGAARGSRCAARSRGATGHRAARSGRRRGSCRSAARRPPCRRASRARRSSPSGPCRRSPSARTGR